MKVTNGLKGYSERLVGRAFKTIFGVLTQGSERCAMNETSLVEGIYVDPVIPNDFWSFTPKGNRPKDHLRWWGRPFIKTVANPYFPSGMRYDVYCLEEGNYADHPALWGMFGTLEEAVRRAKEGPPWHGHSPESGRNSTGVACGVPDHRTGRGVSSR
jgi:hypothetical protein